MATSKEPLPKSIEHIVESYAHVFQHQIKELKQPQIAIHYYLAIVRLHNEYHAEYDCGYINQTLEDKIYPELKKYYGG